MAKQVAASVRDKTSKLAKVLPSLSKKAKKIVTEATILSTIDYCLEIWGEGADTQHRVQVAMNGALREMFGVKKPTDAHVEDLMKEAEWLNVPNRWRQAIIRAMDKMMITRFPEPIWRLLATAPRHRCRHVGSRSEGRAAGARGIERGDLTTHRFTQTVRG